ncbi:hypothetical protein IV64_GL000999 [Lactiplantibacillus xiangfangensis]|uniref:Membrane protein 6-pyruvoyl-tetrahydropterin synthase-related domain-containing protein n=1 Tax=Lactiplantibacillus xiangfangensis TaxID=942150 RepID=A0A0R2MLS4_9LACO|nr:hypothetical protein IV64_GL000999 [Lactiplantibacillus xiangfangensis]
MVKSRLISILWVVGTFAVLALMTIAQVRHHQMLVDTDFIYHMSRIEAFSESVRAHQWFDFRNFVTFNQIGVANNYFYPYVYFWLWSLLYVFVGNPIWSYYIGLFLIMLTGLMITYVSVYYFSKSRFIGYLVAIFHMTTPYHVFLLNGQSVLGEALAATFIPLYVLGVRELLRGSVKHWWLISVALALTAYAHLLTLAIEVSLLLILYLLSLRGEEQRLRRFINCLKAASLFLALTSFFWVPFVQMLLRTPIQATIKIAGVAWLNDFGTMINLMLTNGSLSGITANPGIVALIAVGLTIGFWRYLLDAYRIVAIVGIVFLLGSTSLFPWGMVPNQIQNMIQFPYRLYSLTSFCLILTGARIVEQLISQNRNPIQSDYFKKCTTLVLTGTCIVLYASMLNVNYRIKASSTPYTSVIAPKLKDAFNVRFRLDQHNYTTLFKSPRTFFGTIDYAPKTTWQGDYQKSLIAHSVLVGRKTVRSTHHQNVQQITYQFKLKRASQVDVPVLHYGSEVVVVNGQHVNAKSSKRGSTLIFARAGNNTVMISEPRPASFVTLLGLSVVTWIGLLGIIFQKWWVKRH